ncbi:MAG: acylphosphatase [Parachlamydiales bacterium]
MKERICLRIIFEGKVQGVHFREHIRKYAEDLNIKGYVQNLSDKSVEIVAVSSEKVLDLFLKKNEEKPGFGSIDSLEKKHLFPCPEFESFKIKY